MRRGSLILLTALALTGAGLAAPGARVAAQACARPCVGPKRGAILAAGGGDLGPDIYQKFLRLAGGPNAHIVLIPTAGAEDGSHDAWTALDALREAGAERIEVVHTRNRRIADLPGFVAPLREATGVWISGGQQWRLTSVYLNTLTQKELQGVLDRGGIIAGNSAGASVLASFLLRGSPAGNDVVVDPDHDTGFGFLRGVAIDQHLTQRGREQDLIKVLQDRPELLGIGIDEGTALLITGDQATVIGRGRVAIYDHTDPLTLIPLRYLGPGGVYDLGARQVVLADDGSAGGGR